MRRDVDGIRVEFQHDFQQIMAVQPQNWAPIGVNIADCLQLS